jgi:integrase/recombinase XerD
VHFTLGRRAEAAGIRGFHPHVLRHTAAHRWLAAGGSEGGLMAVAGWARRDMLDRYAAATANERAAAEAKSLNLVISSSTTRLNASREFLLHG